MYGKKGVEWLKTSTKIFTSETFDNENHTYDGKTVLREKEREKLSKGG